MPVAGCCGVVERYEGGLECERSNVDLLSYLPVFASGEERENKARTNCEGEREKGKPVLLAKQEVVHPSLTWDWFLEEVLTVM